MPTSEPEPEIKEASPPDEPPHVNRRSYGFRVRP
jgi:hypothetical protein